MKKWILFDPIVPECGKYERDELAWLAEILSPYELDDERGIDWNEDCVSRLKDMPLGYAIRIEEKVVCLVDWPDKTWELSV